jgi:hypothetical protein
MLTAVALDRGIFTDRLDGDEARLNVLHRRLAEVLLRHAIIVLSDPDEMGRFVDALQAMPQSVRQWWDVALPVIRQSVGRPLDPIENLDDAVTLHQVWGSIADVVVVERLRAMELGVPDSAASRALSDPSMEIVRHDLIDGSETVAGLLQLGVRDIPSGSDREAVWKERFDRLARHSRHVVVFDRYAGRQLLRGRGGGVEWFLQKLDSCGSTSLQLITGCDDASSCQGILGALGAFFASLKAGGLRKVVVIVGSDRAFFNAHARHVRFDSTHAVLVEPGFNIFARRRVDQDFPCALADLDAARARERVILRNVVARETVRETRRD